MVVQNPPRPHYTLARAGLESAAQAVWVLEPDDRTERVHRHLRLLFHDLRQMALAFEAQKDERAPGVRKRMAAIEARVPDSRSFDSIKKGDPTYLSVIRECAPALGMQPNDLESIWRGASAAAHGKDWFRSVGYRAHEAYQYEPAYFLVALLPDPAEITKAMKAASAMLMHGVVRFVTRCGHHPEPLRHGALSRLTAETPRKDQPGDGAPTVTEHG